MLTHSHNLGDNGALGPLHPKHFRQLSQVGGSCLPNGEDCVTEPSHAKIAELFIEELDAQLTAEERDIFDDGKADSPLLVLGQLNNSGEEGLRQKLNSNNYNGQAHIS